MATKSEEVNYKKDFCEKYFDKGCWDLDVLHQVDVHLKDKKGRTLLYIESKHRITNNTAYRQALAQVILTNKKQEAILSQVALIYQDAQHNDILEVIDCSENAVMYNNDFNWAQEKASQPTKDAIDRINDRIRNKITRFMNDEIKAFYEQLKKGQTEINITENNVNVVYNQWKSEVRFKEQIKDEQDLINLFLVDILNGTVYKKSIFKDLEVSTLFGNEKIGEAEYEGDEPLIREGTNLSQYHLMFDNGEIDGIKYSGRTASNYYTVASREQYNFFWRKYKRPPVKEEYLKILEHSTKLYSEQYRRDTGGEYTPSCFVEKQNEILAQHYNLDEFLVFDPCAGVGNLQNQFGKDFKQYCYLSTLEQTDVDICKIKGFENAVQFDYLKDDKQPLFKYKGTMCSIPEICQRERRKLMVIMNPPYQNKTGFKNNLAIEFFNKVLKLAPQVIVFYYMTESFLRSEVEHYKNSGYKIVSHIFSNAKTTFLLSQWSISQVVFDRDNGEPVTDIVTAMRYEMEKGNFIYKNTYIYDQTRPNLIDEIDKEIQKNRQGMILGNVSYLMQCINLTNKVSKNSNAITTSNLIWCLLSRGINFNGHAKYFEYNYLTYRGTIDKISPELFADSIMFGLFYKMAAFTNKDQKNYIMPFTAEELGCAKNDLNVLFPPKQGADLFNTKMEEEKPFDFRVFMQQFEFSAEAKALYNAALDVFKYYHKSDEYLDKDWNDSFYDITNAIMGKDATSFKELETDNDTRITRVKTTKGTKGFGKSTIKYFVPSSALPIFENFFAVRDTLARKINRQLVEQGLLLWERENIY